MRRILSPDGAIFYPSSKMTELTLYSVNTWEKVGMPNDGSFRQAVLFPSPDKNSGGGTAANFVRLGRAEIDYIKSINVNSFRNWKWAADASERLIYQSRPDFSIDMSVDWNRITGCSKDVNNVNVVAVSRTYNGFFRVTGIPRQLTGDYFIFKKYPFLNHLMFGNYGSLPLLYIMPLFEPDSLFYTSKGGRGMWLESIWIKEQVGTIKGPWEVSIN